MVLLNFLLLLELFMAKFHPGDFQEFGGWFCTFMENGLFWNSRLLKRGMEELIWIFFFTVLDSMQALSALFSHGR